MPQKIKIIFMDFNPKNLVIITGPSGAGKTSAAQGFLKKHKNVARLVTYTTRPTREGERDGDDYNFVSREDFQKMAKAGEFFEWAEVYGNFYGNRLDNLKKLCAENKYVVMVLDIQGAIKIKNTFKDAIGIFLTASLDDLAGRIRNRGKMDEAEFARRMKTAEWELAMAKDFDYSVPTKTGEIDDMVLRIENILGM
jgi:guanylate kinase